MDRRTLFLPIETPNQFGSYGFGSYEVLNEGYCVTIELVNLLMNSENPSENATRWEPISRLKLSGPSGFTLDGIKKHFRCDDHTALIAITKFKSCRSNVIQNSNGVYSAWNDTRRPEMIYEWSINGDDFECISNTAIDHFLDDALSQSSSRPVSPSPPRYLASHLLLLSRMVYVYYNYSMK